MADRHVDDPAHVYYLYAVVDAEAVPDAAAAPAGLDGAPVELVREGGVAAVVSALVGGGYRPEHVEERVGDLAWLRPRALAHDAVVSWASARGAAVPSTMFTLFSGRPAVAAMLRERAPALADALGRVRGADEYAVRVFRDDARLSAALPELSPRVAELERTAAAASPGQRYLLERKLAEARRAEVRRVGGEVARRVYAELAARSAGAATDPPPQGDAGVTAVLDAAFLVRRDAMDDFRAALTGLIAAEEPRGFRFEFTGPWPAYHFARDAGASPTAPEASRG